MTGIYSQVDMLSRKLYSINDKVLWLSNSPLAFLGLWWWRQADSGRCGGRSVIVTQHDLIISRKRSAIINWQIQHLSFGCQTTYLFNFTLVIAYQWCCIFELMNFIEWQFSPYSTIFNVSPTPSIPTTSFCSAVYCSEVGGQTGFSVLALSQLARGTSGSSGIHLLLLLPNIQRNFAFYLNACY